MNISKMKYHPLQEQIVGILQEKIQNSDSEFFRLLVLFYFGQIASSMRCNISTLDRGTLPVNMYAINLGKSGVGKGFSTNIITQQLIAGFRKQYTKEVYPAIVEASLMKRADTIALKTVLTAEEEYDTLVSEFKSLGTAVFSFDSGTSPALKQFRQKLIMGGTGALSFIADEIGSTLQEHHDIIKVLLELYDCGIVGDKLIKNTKEQIRLSQIIGATPANMLLFGTPDKLFDGGTNEVLMYSLITTGLARRCFFGVNDKARNIVEDDAETIYRNLTNKSTRKSITAISAAMTNLAQQKYHGITLTAPKKVSIKLIQYEIWCRKRAEQLPINQDDQKAHLTHAYFRVLKAASIYAFIDRRKEISMENLEAAIKVSEDSIAAFNTKVMAQEPSYVRLAKFLADTDIAFTHADLSKEMAFYPTIATRRTEMLQLASAWGYSNNITIKSIITNGVELLSATKLTKTNNKELILSYSKNHHTHGYENTTISFKNFSAFTQYQGWHFTNHRLKGGHRNGDNVVKGFNTILLDVDKNVEINTVKLLMAKYNFVLYTTKRHNKKHPRFRLMLPISHTLEFKEKSYNRFMKNIYRWLPFEVDKATAQRSRKWLTDKGNVLKNSGKNLDALQFIPKTPKADQFQQTYNSMINMNTLERWFARTIETGNRSNTLIRYAFVLIEQGLRKSEVIQSIYAFNNKLGKGKLTDIELKSTILSSVNKRMKRSK